MCLLECRVTLCTVRDPLCTPHRSQRRGRAYIARADGTKKAHCASEKRDRRLQVAPLDMGSHVPPPRENEASERSLPSLSGLMEQYSPSRARAASAGQPGGGRGGFSSSSGVGVGGTGGRGGGTYFGTAFSNRALDRSELALSVSSERSSSPLSLGSRTTQPTAAATAAAGPGSGGSGGPGTSSSSTSSTTSTATNMAATATTSTTGGTGAAGVGTGSALGTTGHLRPRRQVPHRLLPGLGSATTSSPSESTVPLLVCLLARCLCWLCWLCSCLLPFGTYHVHVSPAWVAC